MRHYEGLFLFASRENKPDYAGVEQYAGEVLGKHGAKIVKSQKWAERKLAYEVKRNRRGAYLLIYFDSDPTRIADIRRDLQISERFLRHIVLACEEVPVELPEFMEFKEEPLGGESDFRGRFGGRGGDRREDRGPYRPRRSEDAGEGGFESRQAPPAIASADAGSSRD